MTAMMTFREVTHISIFLISLFVCSHSGQTSNCNFQFVYKKQPVVYNFTRLSSQAQWQALGNENVTASVCSKSTFPQCPDDESSCVIKQDHSWNLMLQVSKGYTLHPLSKPEAPVLVIAGSQPCADDKTYSAEIHFKCSSVERSPVVLDVRNSCVLYMSWHTAAACPVDRSCVLGDLDFSSLRHQDHYEVQVDASTKYLLNLCGPIPRGLCEDSDSVSACEVNGNETRVIGRVTNHHISTEKTGLTIVYTTQSKGPRTEVQLYCNPSAAHSQPKFVKRNSKSNRTYVFEMETPLACDYLPYDDCTIVTQNGAQYDLSTLRKSGGNWMTQPSPSGTQYVFNVCGPLTPVDTYSCAGGGNGACWINSKLNSSISLGRIMDRPYAQGDVLLLRYTGGSPCTKEERHSLEIELSCSRQNMAPVFVKTANQCVHHVSWQRTEACPRLVTQGVNCTVRELQFGHMYNLLSLRSTHTIVSEQGDTYFLNLCGKLSTGTCNGKEASACLKTKNNETYAIGFVNSTVLYDNGGLRLVLHGEGCKCGGNSSTVTVILLCQHGDDLGQPELFPSENECNFYFMWYTNAACPPRQSVDCTLNVGGKSFDLSPLTDTQVNYVVVQRDLNYKFLLNVCHSVIFGHDARCRYTSAACRVNLTEANPTKQFSSIGEVNSENSLRLVDGKLKMKLGSGDICLVPDGPDHITTTFTFECDSGDHLPQLLTGDACTYEFLWRTQYACPLNENKAYHIEDKSCKIVVPDEDKVIDLQPLRNKVMTVSDAGGHNYMFVVCGNLTSSRCGGSGVGVCQYKTNDSSHHWSAGVGNSVLQYNWGAVSLNYSGGAPCSNGVRRSTRIEFVCAENSTEQVMFIEEEDSCNYLISWHTPLACIRHTKCTTDDESDPVDLSPLSRLHENYRVKARNNTVFFINICRPLFPVPGLSCKGGSSACYAELHNGAFTNEKSLGFATRPVHTGGGTVSMRFVGGSKCNSANYNISAKFKFECDPRSGKGLPEFQEITHDCTYKFVWKTDVVCKPYSKNVTLSSDTCVIQNEQMNANINLKNLGQGKFQVCGKSRNYSLELCNPKIGVKSGDTDYGKVTSVVFDYQQQQMRLQLTGGRCSSEHCSSSEQYWAEVQLNCNAESGVGEPKMLKENDNGIIFEWQNADVCEVLSVGHASSHWKDPDVPTDSAGSSVGLSVGLVILTVLVCCLILYFRKPSNRSQLKSRLGSFLGIRHSGQFHYSRLEAADEASQLLVSHMDGQESDSDDELLRM